MKLVLIESAQFLPPCEEPPNPKGFSCTNPFKRLNILRVRMDLVRERSPYLA
jgi:hypothetical protein